ncbi:serine/threonine-protein kinase pim-1-like [Taeniopygia guttata]|uniref:serine/threonine-protein kinase pim-1-like n=1 Tax=Taeniopygia guttata TaxID=59729 RepID=UPI003BB87C5E
MDGPCQYTTFIATINADTSRETVGSAANKFRNCEKMINGVMQAHVSAVIKELKEEFKEKMRKMKEEILLRASFTIKKSKVKGAAREIQFLGAKLQDGQCHIPTEATNKITAMSPPTSKKDTQAFLCAIGFWRMPIPEYNQTVSLLYLVTHKKNDFHWGPAQQQAFAQIKQEIAHAVALGPPDGTSAPLEIVLLDKVSTGFPGVVQLLEWLELPNNIVMVLERPERSQDLLHFIRARRFLSEAVARQLFRQVLEAVRHCTSRGVLHRDIKPENILVDLATGQAKLIDFGCGTYLQDTAYTHFAGTLSYSPPEWTHLGWYHGEAATIWSLGILLHQMVCGQHPFRRGRKISWDHQLLLPQRLSPECQDLIRWCLSMHFLDRPSLEDLFCDPWIQDIHLP